MLVINKKAQCYICANKIRVSQKDGTESSEIWVCDSYKKGCPTNVIIKAKICIRFKKGNF